ncbi:putative F-box domain, FBD domain, leucine-rich repeat domain superfamily [Helianthus annuus]|uniref:F-box domain, FBD domain, leucine-rich repeat domain superfamily n=1 Tax=Helianthus annuus TaxID=4232 RepID=A0A9K3DV55_HELAN|nr:putative F-box domain, FBD domain, leucine-rich repeat domain superfamily [Helianthus annuus]KAJ0439899.1 putative F-box domain, FBD domain, F-box-like domain superfamily protein [Helianthus annuus]KAJ0462273.1 putative F-box domain, FBD domain, F-box-like domain superfamily protein [Helianthus annuus]KAJ0837961.1 putative F-box domain, FBD domain, leucine-rich repeat domain superfamily [Helianthus annuus]
MEYQNPTRTQSDIISTLPLNIIEHILARMPLRDALRTSVLSKKWRYTWRSMPKLTFTDDMVKLPSNQCCGQLMKYKVAYAIFHVLLLHNGPIILEFRSLVGHLRLDSEFAPIISYLERGSKVKRLTFFRVKVPPQMLQQFLSKCPLLEYLCLIGSQNGLDFVAGETKFTFVDLFSVCAFDSDFGYLKVLHEGSGMPHKLPDSLVHLKYLFLDVCMAEKNEISALLCMIMSSSLLEKIGFLMCDNEKLDHLETLEMNLDPQDYPDMKLDHLVSLWIEDFSNLRLEMEFVKLIMAKSPVLKKVRIVLDGNVSVDEELEMLRDLVLHPIPRASPSAKLAIVRPKTSS